MSSDCSVKVVCRIRPLNNKELSAGDKAVVSAPTDSQILQGVRRLYEHAPRVFGWSSHHRERHFNLTRHLAPRPLNSRCMRALPSL